MCSLSGMSDSLQLPWTVVRQALSMEFSRQEYWSGLPFPSPGDLSDPRIEPVTSVSPALASQFFNASTTWEALYKVDTLMCSLEMRKQRHRGVKLLAQCHTASKQWSLETCGVARFST